MSSGREQLCLSSWSGRVSKAGVLLSFNAPRILCQVTGGGERTGTQIDRQTEADGGGGVKD